MKLAKYIIKMSLANEKFVIVSAKKEKELKEWLEAYTDADAESIEVYKCDGMGYDLIERKSKSEQDEFRPIGFLR